MSISKGQSAAIMGIFILGLALIMWRSTLSLPGWAALFLPGAALVVRGVYVIIRDEI